MVVSAISRYLKQLNRKCTVWGKNMSLLVLCIELNLSKKMLGPNTRTTESDLIWKEGHHRCNQLRYGRSGVEWASNPL